MIYVWLSRFLYQATAGPQQHPSLSVGCLRGLLSTGRSLTPVDAGVRMCSTGGEPTHTNETLLSVPCVHHPTKWKMCMCERETETIWVGVGVVHMCSVCVVAFGVRVCDFCVCKCVWQVGGGYFYSCYILWQQSDSAFRSVQTMRLTQRCSPQPQCKLHFLKPAP